MRRINCLIDGSATDKSQPTGASDSSSASLAKYPGQRCVTLSFPALRWRPAALDPPDARESPAGALSGRGLDAVAVGATAASAAQVAERIRVEFNATPTVFDGVTSTLSLSAGVADSGGDCALDTVLKNANVALRRLKGAGRNCVTTFSARDSELS